MIKKSVLLSTVAAMAALWGTQAMAQFQSAMDISQQTIRESEASQQKINSLDDESNRLLGDFRANLKQAELLERFNKSRAREIESQAIEIERSREDLSNVENLQRSMTPLMEKMLSSLEDFVAADLPFLEEIRAERIARIKGIMTDSEVTEARRFSNILEAYQIESEYGTTLATYDKVIDNNGAQLKVEFLKIGRLALIYKSADDSVLKIFDQQSDTFVDLDRKFLGDVRYGLKMAKEQTPPNLLPIPVAVPAAASQ